MPKLGGPTLAGKQLELPDAAHGRVTLLVCGFTHGSAQSNMDWCVRWHKEFGEDPRFAQFPVAIMESAPRLLRGMIVSSLRHAAPPWMQPSFITLFHDEASWKRTLSFSEPDHTYLLLLDPQGNIRARNHAVFGESVFTSIAQQSRALVEGRAADEKSDR